MKRLLIPFLFLASMVFADTPGQVLHFNSPLVNTAGTISLPAADSSHNGYLNDSDWATFNGKADPLTPGTFSTSTTGVSISSGANSTVGPNVTLNVQTANVSQPGLLSASDWAVFYNKQSALDFVAPIVNTTGSISMAKSDTSHDGYLSSTDWTTFNNKISVLDAGNISTSTTGVTIGNGNQTTIGPNVTVNVQTASGSQPGLLSATDWNNFNTQGLQSPLASSLSYTSNWINQPGVFLGDLTDSDQTHQLIVYGGKDTTNAGHATPSILITPGDNKANPSTSTPGNIFIVGSNSTNSAVPAGAISLYSGSVYAGNGNAGETDLFGGSAFNGAGGSAVISGGNSTNGNGGDVQISSGAANVGNNGNIILNSKSGSSAAGAIKLNDGSAQVGYLFTSTGTDGSGTWMPGGLSIGGPVSGGSNFSVLFIDGSGNLGQNSNFYFDASAGEYLSIGDQDGVYQIDGTEVLSRDNNGNIYLGASRPNSVPLTGGAMNNLIAGLNAGLSITSGNSNSLGGNDAGTAINTGSNNTIFGFQSGVALTSQNFNTFLGSSCGTNNTGNGNVGMGYSSVQNGSGDYNTGVGLQTLTGLSSGGLNTAIGVSSGGTIDSGDRNTVIGANADVGTSGVTNASAFGNSARVDASNSLVLGSGVNVGIDTIHSPTARLHIPPGTATAHSAPLKIDSGTVLTTPEAGAIEFDGTNLFYTTSVPARKTVANNNLSNLASTAVGTDLKPAVDNTNSLGLPSKRWGGASIVGIDSLSSLTADGDLQIEAGSTSNVVTVNQGVFVAGPVAPNLNDNNTTPYDVDITFDNVILQDVGSASVINLPVAPADGYTIIVKDITGAASSNHITVNAGSGQTIEGGGSSLTISTNFGSRTLVFHGSVWYILASI